MRTSPEPRDVILHIGSGKTGTSSIQQFLHLNRSVLKEHGVLYPRSPGRRRHVRLGLYAASAATLERTPSWRRQPEETPGDLRRVVRRRLGRELAASGGNAVVFSDEALFSANREAIGRMRKLMDEFARSVRIVVYLRRQDDHFCSRYQQAVKIGEVRRMSERVTHPSLLKSYDYKAHLDAWQQALGPDSIVLRPFEREQFEAGDLLADFVRAAGLRVPMSIMTPVDSVNESLDAECVEFLRVLNLYRVEHQDAQFRMIDNREVVDRLLEVSSGPTLTLPETVLDQFMAQWADGNSALARDFVHEARSELFVMPRKTHNTTVKQFFDPARVEEFADLIELAKEDRRSLHKVAEREARGRVAAPRSPKRLDTDPS